MHFHTNLFTANFMSVPDLLSIRMRNFFAKLNTITPISFVMLSFHCDIISLFPYKTLHFSIFPLPSCPLSYGHSRLNSLDWMSACKIMWLFMRVSVNFFMSGGESPAVRPTDVAATIRAPNLRDHRILSFFKVLPLGTWALLVQFDTK